MQYDVIWCDAIRYDTVTKHHILFSLFMIFFSFLNQCCFVDADDI